MTREEIFKMEVGTELDALIHEKILGKCWHKWNSWIKEQGQSVSMSTPRCLKCGILSDFSEPPRYSTDISAAWQVVEKLEGAWDIKKRYRPHPDDPPMSGGRATYQATAFLSHYDPYEDELVNERTGRSPWCWSVEEAICKAALLAKLEAK